MEIVTFIRERFVPKFLFTVTCLLATLISFSQDKKEVDININAKDNNWWGQPWVWIVGAAVFILLLAAILKSNSSSSKAQ